MTLIRGVDACYVVTLRIELTEARADIIAETNLAT